MTSITHHADAEIEAYLRNAAPYSTTSDLLTEAADRLVENQNPTDARIKEMVIRFLAWKLPAAFSPDAGVSFKAEFNENTQWPMRHEPSGTNLLSYPQAEAMIRHILGAEQ